VTGVDRDASQVGVATERARAAGIGNVSFRQASVYELPFADGQFDALFSHALFEHLADPVRAARECLRVVKPGGIVGVATPDWGGFLVAPVSPAMTAAIRAYEDLQHRNGGNPRVGRELGRVFAEAGFAEVRLSARYENYAPLSVIGELLAFQLEDDGQPHHAETLRAWQHDPAGLFAQAWVSCLARRP
jgi:ubiquinone/menaquinone biosynthesis C-methylase UbiE